MPHWIYLAILLAGFALRLGLHDYHGLEGDDGVSLALSRYDPSALIRGLMALELDVHPPLHYIALKGWTGLVGDSLLSLRLMNILADVLTGALLVALAHRAFGNSVGAKRRFAPITTRIASGREESRPYRTSVVGTAFLPSAKTLFPIIAALLWALSPLLIYTGYLIRMYTLLTLFVTAGAVCLFSERRTAYIGAAVCTLAAMYTHITGVIALVVFGAVILVRGMLRLVSVRDTLIGSGWLLLATLLYLPFALPVLEVYRSGRRLGAEYNPGNFANPLDVPGTILSVMLTHRLLDAGYIVLFLFGVGTALLLWRGGRRVVPFLVLVWASVAALSIMAVAAGLYKPRYLTAFVPPVLVLVAGVVSLIPRRAILGAVLLGLVLLCGAGIRADLDHSIRDDWVAAADFVAAHELPGDVIIVIPDWGQEALRFHYRGAAPVIGVFPQVSQGVDFDGVLTSLVEGHERVWLVRYQPEVSDAANLADEWFRARAATITEVFPTGMQVKGYDFTPQLSSLPEFVHPLDARFGNVAALRGVYLPVVDGSARDTRLHPPSAWVQVILYWERLQPGAEFVPRVRLTDTSGQVYGGALAYDNGLLERVPVTAWEPSTLYRIAYDLNLNPDTPPGVYNIEVMVLASDEPLPATGTDAGAHWVIAGQYRVEG